MVLVLEGGASIVKLLNRIGVSLDEWSYSFAEVFLREADQALTMKMWQEIETRRAQKGSNDPLGGYRS